jgi:hypothetical protein
MKDFFEDPIGFIRRLCDPEQEQKIKKRQGGNIRSLEPSHTSQKPVASPQPLTVALHLVVPALVVNDVRANNPINASQIEKLIDNASYFLCTKVTDPDLIEQNLEFTNQSISTIAERREVYIRIHIADGQEMLDKKVPYILKRDLPSHGQGVVKQLACLEDFSGLEKFNRV